MRPRRPTRLPPPLRSNLRQPWHRRETRYADGGPHQKLRGDSGARMVRGQRALQGRRSRRARETAQRSAVLSRKHGGSGSARRPRHAAGRLDRPAPSWLSAVALGRGVLRQHRLSLATGNHGIAAALSGSHRLRRRSVEATARLCHIGAQAVPPWRPTARIRHAPATAPAARCT